jgi:hypothetical protein
MVTKKLIQLQNVLVQAETLLHDPEVQAELTTADSLGYSGFSIDLQLTIELLGRLTGKPVKKFTALRRPRT